MKNENNKINIELTNDELLCITEMLEHYVTITSEEIDIDNDLLNDYNNVTKKLIDIYSKNFD